METNKALEEENSRLKATVDGLKNGRQGRVDPH